MLSPGRALREDVREANVVLAERAALRDKLAGMRKATYHLLIVILWSSSLLAAEPRKMFLVEKTYAQATASGYGNNASAQAVEISFTPKIMTEFEKKCPTVSFTTDKSTAEFVLNPQVGGSMLMNKKGDVVYISPAKTLHNMVKDVCLYLEKH